jgi:hypothetical protein
VNFTNSQAQMMNDKYSWIKYFLNSHKIVSSPGPQPGGANYRARNYLKKHTCLNNTNGEFFILDFKCSHFKKLFPEQRIIFSELLR